MFYIKFLIHKLKNLIFNYYFYKFFLIKFVINNINKIELLTIIYISRKIKNVLIFIYINSIIK